MKEARTRTPGLVDVSRRRLLTGAGYAGGGLLLGSAFPTTAFADDDQSCAAGSLCSSPNPIPHVNEGVLALFGVKVHFFFAGPVEGTAAATDPTGVHPGGRDPSSIYDFEGFIGQADMNLTGTGTDLNTGVSQPYSFHADNRFMSGVFLGTEGAKRRGTFAFLWIDSLGSASPHSYDVGISRTTVFWTAPVSPSSVQVDFDDAEAALQLRNYCVLDTFTLPNSFDASHPMGVPAGAVIHSLKMNWSGIKRKTSFTSTDPQDHFAGNFIEDSATIEVDVTTLPSTGHGFHFVSDPAHTTVSNFAQIGRERNGKFAV